MSDTILPLPTRVTCKRDLEGHARNTHAAVLGRTGLCDDPQPVFEKLPEGPTKYEFDADVEMNLQTISKALGELEAGTRARFFHVLSGVFCHDCGRALEALPGDHSCSSVYIVRACESGYEPAEWAVAAYATFGGQVMAEAHAGRANARARELAAWRCKNDEGWGIHVPGGDLCDCGETRPTNEWDPYEEGSLRDYAYATYSIEAVPLRKGIGA